MQITTDLKLTFPVKWNDAGHPTIYAYHVPISREVFERSWRIISTTSARLLQPGTAPDIISVSTLALKDAGRADAIESGLPEGLDYAAGGTAVPLLAELKRLTFILAPSPNGYQMLPIEAAIARKVIDEDDWAEAEDALVFFTCGWWSASRQRRAATAPGLASALGGLITSSSPTDFAASLPTSTPAETSVGETVEAPKSDTAPVIPQ